MKDVAIEAPNGTIHLLEIVQDEHSELQKQPERIGNANELSLDNYPNPFNPSTLITFSVPKSGHVSLKVYDALMREASVLLDAVMPSGIHQVSFDGTSLSGGVYYCKLSAGNTSLFKKLVLMK